jgi:hypothetical protein
MIQNPVSWPGQSQPKKIRGLKRGKTGPIENFWQGLGPGLWFSLSTTYIFPFLPSPPLRFLFFARSLALLFFLHDFLSLDSRYLSLSQTQNSISNLTDRMYWFAEVIDCCQIRVWIAFRNGLRKLGFFSFSIIFGLGWI